MDDFQVLLALALQFFDLVLTVLGLILIPLMAYIKKIDEDRNGRH